MLGHQFKKLISIFLLLFALSIIVFLLRFATPQDPVEQSLDLFQQENSDMLPYSIDEYEKEAIKLGLDKELFYFSLKPNYIPEGLNKILLPNDKKNAKSFLKKGFDWEDIQAFINLKNNSPHNLLLTQIATELNTTGKVSRDYSQLSNSNQLIINNLVGNVSNKLYYPVFRWHGNDNQYHQWIKSFFQSNELRSKQNNSLVKPKIKRALIWTLSIAIVGLFFNYILGVFIGFKRVSSKNPIWEKIQTFLDFFYTMPSFWICTLATNIFPSVHSFNFNGDPILVEIFKNIKYIILPIICISLKSVGLISSMMADNLKLQLNKPYLLTAKQKGLSRQDIIRNHGFKNAMFPILTMLTNAIPRSFSGSLIIEIIFNIPGIGRLMYNSILTADWNVVFPIILIVGTVTSLSYWLSDILYSKFDPRVSTVAI